MAEVRKRKYKSGKEVYFVDYIADGIRRREVVGSSKLLAQQIAKDIEVKTIKESSDLYVKEIKTKDFFEYIKKFNETNLRKKTAVRYKNAIDNFSEFLGDRVEINLSRISVHHAEQYKSASAKEHKTGTVNTEIKILRTIFNHAIRFKFTRTNPFKEVKTVKLAEKIPDAYSEEEVEKLIECAPEPFDDIFRLFLQTGMRRDELRFLEVRDVLFDRGLIHIREKPGFVPKTAEGFIPMTSQARLILEKYCSKAGNGLIFKSRNGRALYPRQMLDVIKRAAKKAKVANPTIHRLRHTFCSYLLTRGVDIEIIRQLARHANIKTTQRYLHVRADQLQKSVEVMSRYGTPKARQAEPKEEAVVNH